MRCTSTNMDWKKVSICNMCPTSANKVCLIKVSICDMGPTLKKFQNLLGLNTISNVETNPNIFCPYKK